MVAVLLVALAPSLQAQETADPAPAAPDRAAVTHEVSFPALRRQTVHVTSRFPAEGDVVTLRLPTWAPGSYVLRPFDAALELLEVQAGGVPVSWDKVARDSWRVGAGGEDLVVRYRVLADRRSVSGSWVSEDYVLLNGTSVFLYTDASRDLPQSLSVGAPGGPGRAYSALAEVGTGSWRAGDYDELVDNPLVIARATPRAFEADDHAYRLLTVGDTRLWDEEAAVRDLGAVVAATNALFEEVPLERPFWFINLLNEETGGLEHDHATVMQASRWQMRDRRRYVQWLSLAAHEYVHAWNVRRMRPAALARYDYRREQYTDDLWVAEGLTSYYDDLLLSRARVASPSEYLERLAAHVHVLEHTPGRLRQSMSDASRDAWTRHYQPGANALNLNVSYYVKGAVVAFVLDARIREESRGRQSLDDVMALMWSRWRERPYPEGAFYEAVAEVAGDETVAWLRPLVEGVDEPEVDAALAWYGLALERHPARSAAEAAGLPPPAGLGINWRDSGEALVVEAVVDGGPAADAGVLPGDELLAVDGERLLRSDYEAKLRRRLPGQSVELLLSRQARIQVLEATLAPARSTHYEVRVKSDFRDRQRRRLRSWLGQRLDGG